ncbi:MAG TPA: tetratricopeptide repeat protein [Candidatus Binatia bacterium]
MRSLPPQVPRRARCIVIAAAILLGLAAALLAQEKEYFVSGKKVSEPVYRAARLTNDALPLIEAGRLDNAKDALLEALRLAPDFYLARYNLAVLYTRLGEDDAAVAELTKLVSARPEMPEAWVTLAGIYCNRGKYDEALSLLDEAVRAFPAADWRNVQQYSYNRGLALTRTGRSAEAIEQFKAALASEPEREQIWLNLAVLYQETGNLDESIAHYKQFLQRASQDADSSVVADALKNLEREYRLVKSRPASEANGQDYYFLASQGRARNWPKQAMPLRVYIHDGEGQQGFQPRYIDILKSAFDEWSAASQGRVKFRFTNRLADAHIECLWSSDPKQLKSISEGGETRLFYRENGGIYDAQIVILTVPVSRLAGVTDRSIRFIALHEIGHALGILGHSNDPRDVMYFAIPVAETDRELSARDKKTLLRFYGQK